MEYRTLPRGGEKISVIGMGASVIGARPEGELIDTVRAACESGINCFDLPGRPGGQAGERTLPDPGEDRVGLPRPRPPRPPLSLPRAPESADGDHPHILRKVKRNRVRDGLSRTLFSAFLQKEHIPPKKVPIGRGEESATMGA